MWSTTNEGTNARSNEKSTFRRPSERVTLAAAVKTRTVVIGAEGESTGTASGAGGGLRPNIEDRISHIQNELEWGVLMAGRVGPTAMPTG